MHSIKYDLITILGPTACGKTNFASNLAYHIDGEIISADSRQVYKDMNIGTGKDYEDYEVEGTKIPYYLIDIVNPGGEYNVFEFQKDFLQVYQSILNRGKKPILCGGTGLYIESIIKKYKLLPVPPNNELVSKLEKKTLEELKLILKSYRKLHNITDTDTKKRAIRAIEIEEYYKFHTQEDNYFPDIKTVFIGLSINRDQRRKRITERLTKRLEEGLIKEVESLLNNKLAPDDLIYYGLEYKYVTLYLIGKLEYNEMVEKLNIAINQFAKRQMTWYRKMEKEGIQINWLNGNDTMEKKIVNALNIISK